MNPPPRFRNPPATSARQRPARAVVGNETDVDESAIFLWADPVSGDFLTLRMRCSEAFRERLIRDGFRPTGR